MANWDTIAFNVGSFVCALFVLEFGADKFIDNTVIVARRTGVPQGLIALLTAGAEWEELIVVVASIARNRSSLAIGNIIGSSISNILGAFSLGLIFYPSNQTIVFDRSSKLYTLLLLILTSLVTLTSLVDIHGFWRLFGGALLIFFAIYTVSVAWAISRGVIEAPELSDSSDDSDDEIIADENTRLLSSTEVDIESQDTLIDDVTSGDTQNRTAVDHADLQPHRRLRGNPHSLKHHVFLLLLGFGAISLSGYVLSHTSTTLSDEFGTSDVLFGVVVLSIATTLPEKFIAVLSGVRGQPDILVANTVGSNIFLLSLCMGITFCITAGKFDQGSVNAIEIAVMMCSTFVLTLTVWFGAKWRQLIGALMLIGYATFLVLEFTAIRKI